MWCNACQNRARAVRAMWCKPSGVSYSVQSMSCKPDGSTNVVLTMWYELCRVCTFCGESCAVKAAGCKTCG
eukprot:1554169-Pyramimonas_sp.AAC.1